MKKIEKIGVQLYTVRDFMDNEKDIAETFQKLKALGYDQIQTAGCRIPYERYAELAEKSGLEIVGTHDDFAEMCENFEQAWKKQEALNTKLMGIGGYFGAEEQRNLKETEELIKRVNMLGEKAAQRGGKFTYHNHNYEFVRIENGKIIMDMLVEEFDPNNVSFVLDTYWVQCGGGDVCEWIDKLANRIDIFHLKDMTVSTKIRAPFFAEIGNGNMNWEKILLAAQNAGVKYYVVEQDICPGDPFESLKISSDYLHKNFM